MGKIFITDEINDSLTVGVTRAGKLKIEESADLYFKWNSAHSYISGWTATSANGGNSPVFLKSITIMEYPATAGGLTIMNTSVSAGNVSAFATSGEQNVCTIGFPFGMSSGETSAGFFPTPVTIPFNIYLASGLTFSTHSANDVKGRVGCFPECLVTFSV